jgi:hypothetical protein
LVSELGGWYTRSVPEMGFYVEERRFGFYQLQKDTVRVRATLRHLPAEEVPMFLKDLREYSADDEITFHVDDRELDERTSGPSWSRADAHPTWRKCFWPTRKGCRS